jgi:hypothetical protein
MGLRPATPIGSLLRTRATLELLTAPGAALHLLLVVGLVRFVAVEENKSAQALPFSRLTSQRMR